MRSALKLAEMGETVLVTSHTNRAVDSALERMPEGMCVRVEIRERVAKPLEKVLLDTKVRELPEGKKVLELERAIKRAASRGDLEALADYYAAVSLLTLPATFSMVRLYFDIETYRQRSAFDEKIIAIGVIEDWTPFSESSLNREVDIHVFSEKNCGDESKIVHEFYGCVRDVSRRAKSLNIIGFGILRFDIPLLIQKGYEYGVGSLSELNRFWHDTRTIDLFQVMLPANGMMFRGNSLREIVKKANDIGLPIPQLYREGKEMGFLYEKGEFNEIEKHLVADLSAIRALDLTKAVYRLIGKSGVG